VLISTGLSAVAMAVAMASAVPGLDPRGSIATTAVLVLASTAVGALGVTLVSGAFMHVSVEPPLVVVRNLLWRKRIVPLTDVVDARAHASGIELTLADGGRICCSAVQHGPVRRIAGRPDRGVRAARQIRRAGSAAARVRADSGVNQDADVRR
jgi:hypothetical protein